MKNILFRSKSFLLFHVQQKKRGGGERREKMHVFASATTNTLLRVKQTPKNKKTKNNNKSEKKIIISFWQSHNLPLPFFFILISWSQNFELFNNKNFQFNLSI
jgi:hypothetical protein